MSMVSTLRERLLGSDEDFQRFVLFLALATAVPMLVVPATRSFHPEAGSVLSIAGLLSFLGGPAHVSSTTWFYADPVARGHFREHLIRYMWAPIALTLGATAMYVVWQEQAPTRWLNVVFTCWLLWHYQRQNWGIHSFVSRVLSGESASRAEEWILRFAVFAGLIAGFKTVGFGGGTPLVEEAIARPLFYLGAVITMSLPLAIAWVWWRTPGVRQTPARLGTLLVGAGFFIPTFVFGDTSSMFLTYALAHGLQYLVFMSYVAARTGRPPEGRPGIFTLIGCILTVGVILSVTGDYVLVRDINALPLYGLSIGLTMGHFVIDAGMWRLRDEFPRNYIGAAFPFLAKR